MVSYEFRHLVSIPSTVSLEGADAFRLRIDAQSLYFVMPEGVWIGQSPLISGAPLRKAKTPDGQIENFYVSNQSWFLLKRSGTDGRVFLRSNDSGLTWEPLDDGLEVESGGRKFRLVPTRMSVMDDVVFLNAGGGRNLLSSHDDGRHWALLAGSMGAQAAYPGEFLVRGSDVLVGGEAPLDFAYLEKGKLNSRATGWITPLTSVAPEGIGNRNVQFIEENSHGRALFAGVEGGLIKSTDDGRSWRWVQKFEQGDEKYPYIQHILCIDSQRIWVGGFDKANDIVPYLSMSEDEGKRWIDQSKVLSRNSDWKDVLAIQTSGAGQLLVAVFDSKAMTVDVGELIALEV